MCPTYDAAALSVRIMRTFGEPFIKALGGVFRQRALAGEAGNFSDDAPQRVQKEIGQAGKLAADAAEKIHRADHALLQGKSVRLRARVEQFGLEQRHVHVGGTFVRAGAAAQAVRERVIQFLGLQRVVIRAAMFERGAN